MVGCAFLKYETKEQALAAMDACLLYTSDAADE